MGKENKQVKIGGIIMLSKDLLIPNHNPFLKEGFFPSFMESFFKDGNKDHFLSLKNEFYPRINITETDKSYQMQVELARYD